MPRFMRTWKFVGFLAVVVIALYYYIDKTKGTTAPWPDRSTAIASDQVAVDSPVEPYKPTEILTDPWTKPATYEVVTGIISEASEVGLCFFEARDPKGTVYTIKTVHPVDVRAGQKVLVTNVHYNDSQGIYHNDFLWLVKATPTDEP